MEINDGKPKYTNAQLFKQVGLSFLAAGGTIPVAFLSASLLGHTPASFPGYFMGAPFGLLAFLLCLDKEDKRVAINGMVMMVMAGGMFMGAFVASHDLTAIWAIGLSWACTVAIFMFTSRRPQLWTYPGLTADALKWIVLVGVFIVGIMEYRAGYSATMSKLVLWSSFLMSLFGLPIQFIWWNEWFIERAPKLAPQTTPVAPILGLSLMLSGPIGLTLVGLSEKLFGN